MTDHRQHLAPRARRGGVLLRVGLTLAVAVLLIALGGPMLVVTVAPDAEAPPHVERILPRAKRYLVGQLDAFTSVVRYVGWEHRERDDLVILMFELRPFPFVTVDRAYLGSRCTPIEDLDPEAMGGGRGIQEFRTDPELEYLRSDAQPSCSHPRVGGGV